MQFAKKRLPIHFRVRILTIKSDEGGVYCEKGEEKMSRDSTDEHTDILDEATMTNEH